MQKLLIVDTSYAFATSLCERMRSICDVRICSNSCEIISSIESYRPDLLLLDLMMPGLDGIYVLEVLHEQDIRPSILATARFPSSYLQTVSQRFHLDYLMIHPLDLNRVAVRLTDMLSCLDGHLSLYAASLSKIMNKLGFSEGPIGYRHLMFAIPMIVKDPDLPYNKVVYAQVAKQTSGSAEQVEKCIRYEISKTWNIRNNDVWKEYFPCDADGNVRKPTNRQFISTIATLLRNEY